MGEQLVVCFIDATSIRKFAQFYVLQIAAENLIFRPNTFHACLIHAFT